MKKTVGTIMAALAGGLLSLGIYTHFVPNKTVMQVAPAPVIKTGTDVTPVPVSGVDFTVAAERTVNGVVHIKTITKTTVNQRFMDPFEQFFFGNPFQRQIPQMGAGSGVIITEDGYIITNNHVVDRADEIEVTLNDKRTYKAKVIGTDPNTDLAVIKIDESGLPVVPFGNSDQVKVGEWVLAVGNPFNLTSTVTAGIVSAKGRNIDIIQENYKIESFIQTDAAVNPGNSGGALVNVNGELIGINTAISSHTGSYEGYAFAIPSNLVQKVARDLIEFGTVQRGLLGVNIKEINAEFAKLKGIQALEGVWVEAPIAGGAAEEAGIRAGDIILQVNGVKVNSVSALQEQIGLYRPGDRVKLLVSRSGKQEEVVVTLKNKAGTTQLLDKPSEVNSLLGARFRPLTEEELQKYKLPHGIMVEEVTNGKLRNAGVKAGYIITEINGKQVKSLDDLTQALNSSKGIYYIGGMYKTGEKVYYSFN